MPFDPNKPFSVTTGAASFDPAKPFQVVAAAPSPAAPVAAEAAHSPSSRPSLAERLGQDALGLGAGAGKAFGDQMLGGQELAGHALSSLGFSSAGQWLIDDALRGVKKLAGEEAPYEKEAPISTTAGEFIGGSVPAIVATEASTAPALTKAVAGGALSGLLTPTNGGADFAKQKVEQAALGAGAGAVTHGLLTGAANLIAPRVSPEVKALLDRGVRLTPGQLAGGSIHRAEDAIASIPAVGMMVRSARREGLEDFNRAVLSDVLAPLGEKLPARTPTGTAGIDYVQGRLAAAYDHLLSGKTFKVDAQFASDIAGLRQAVSKLMPPEVSGLRTLINDRIIPRLQKTGTMDGQTFQELDSELTKYADRYRKSPIAGEKNLGDVIEAMQEKIRDGMERSNPGFAPEYAAIRRSYAMLSRAKEASTARVASTGTFTPADLLKSLRGSAAKTGRQTAFATGHALMQPLAQAGQRVLPATVPDSGTPERLVTVGLLGGAGIEHTLPPSALAALGVTALPYTSPGMSAARALARPGPARAAIGDLARSLSPYVAPGVAAQTLNSLGVH